MLFDLFKKKEEIGNQVEIDGFFKSLGDSTSPQRFDKAAEAFRASLQVVLKESADNAREVVIDFMNFLSDDGLIQNSDTPAWEVPYGCRVEGFKRLMAKDWAGLSKKFSEPGAVQKVLSDSLEQDFPLSKQAQAFFGLKKDRDPLDSFPG